MNRNGEENYSGRKWKRSWDWSVFRLALNKSISDQNIDTLVIRMPLDLKRIENIITGTHLNKQGVDKTPTHWQNNAKKILERAKRHQFVKKKKPSFKSSMKRIWKDKKH